MGIKRKAPHHGNTRRQWGSDHRDQPIPIVAPPISDRRIMIGRLAIVLTVSAWFTYVFLTIVQQFVEGDASSARLVIEAIVYIIVVTALTASAMAYLITRIGFFYRSRAHHRAPRAAADRRVQAAGHRRAQWAPPFRRWMAWPSPRSDVQEPHPALHAPMPGGVLRAAFRRVRRGTRPSPLRTPRRWRRR